MILRAPMPNDAVDILRIVRANDLPAAWTWPAGKHGIVADAGRVVAFCILSESIYGLVVEELWEEPSLSGFRGLSRLSERIEQIAQTLANERGEPLACGGIIRLEKEAHIKALGRRGYATVATVMEKVFVPAPGRAIGAA